MSVDLNNDAGLGEAIHILLAPDDYIRLKDLKIGEFFLKRGYHERGIGGGIYPERPGVVEFIYGVCMHNEIISKVKCLGYFRNGGSGQFCSIEENKIEEMNGETLVDVWENTWIDFGEFWI